MGIKTFQVIMRPSVEIMQGKIANYKVSVHMGDELVHKGRAESVTSIHSPPSAQPTHADSPLA